MRVSTQSRLRVCSIAASSTVTRTPDSRIVAVRSSSPPRTSASPGRCSNRRRFTEPLASTTALASIEVTRPIGTKIRRRCWISTTSPSTRGESGSGRNITTTSRARPTGSPFGSNTATPASLAT